MDLIGLPGGVDRQRVGREHHLVVNGWEWGPDFLFLTETYINDFRVFFLP